MEQFTIASYKYGLDTRKDVLTAQPGTLQTCENASINPGGEIEKRKAFVLLSNLAILDSDGFQGTFGLENTEDGLITFGSALPFGSSPALSQAILASAIPTTSPTITYQQLIHPAIDPQGDSYDNIFYRMVQVVSSENFNGKAFVLAKFTDGNTFMYYDGVIIPQSYEGLILNNIVTEPALHSDTLDEAGWVQLEGVDEFGNAEIGSTIIKSTKGDYFTPIVTTQSTNGFVGVRTIGLDNFDGAETAGQRALAGFQITANTGPFVLTAPANSDGTGTAQLTCGQVVAAGTIAATAGNIARAVNDFTSVHGYTAVFDGVDKVFIYAPASWGNVTFNLTVTGATTAVATGIPSDLKAVLDPSPLQVTRALNHAGTGFYTVKGDVKASASGGNVTSYLYAWSEASTGSANQIGINALQGTSGDLPTASFYASLQAGTTRTGQFKCIVTSSSNPAVFFTAYVTVTLTVLSLN